MFPIADRLTTLGNLPEAIVCSIHFSHAVYYLWTMTRIINGVLLR